MISSTRRRNETGAGKLSLVLALLLLAAVGVGLYFYAAGSGTDSETTAVETETEPAPEPEESASEPEPEPAEPPPDLPSTGALHVSASVEGATVFIDGEPVGEAPFENQGIAIGRYEIKVTREGFQDFVEEVRVRPGRRAELRATLERSPPSLRIASDIPGATVFLDRNYVGTTPVRIDAVDPGEHQLTVSAEGYDMYAETIQITEEQGHRDVNIRFQAAAQTLEESVAVEHKHTFGACQGRLIADHNGIRYATDNDNDGFAVNFDALERFEVDYIDKNLNLKVRGGRNYNFTEPSGNADALFVFHKNVQSFLES